MGEIKPIGSEKLNGDLKLKRILELTYYNDTKKTSKDIFKHAEFISESKIGGVYGIVREKDDYFVKKGLNESSLDYIGGLFMKNKNRFSSYGDALKRLDLLKGQEELQEATKYVLKNKSTQEPVPSVSDVPSLPPIEGGGDLPSPPVESGDDIQLPPTEGGDSMDPSLPPSDDQDGSVGKKSDYMAEAQKFAGKLGQELRDLRERMESDDIKYILNMVISAVNLDMLDEDDLEDIAKKFDRDEEEEGDEIGMDDAPAPDEDGSYPEDDLSEIDGIDGLQEFINSSFDETNEIDLENYADLGENSYGDDIKELDLDEIKREINNTIGKTLSKYFK
jgi:hypothetical protein